MTMMTATAVITAVDRASAVFARVGQAAQAQARRFQAAAGSMNRFTTTTAAATGAGSLFAASVSMQGEKQIDYISRLMQSAGELTVQQREMLKGSALESSVRTGIRAQELLEAQRELIQGGLDASTTSSMTETFAKVARANGIEAKKVAEDAINVANALGFAMGTTEEKVASLTRAMEFMSVVPNLSTESWEGLRTSLKYAAPVAGALKIPITQLGAALSILADAGFKGEEAGTALRTIMVRALAPTRQARLEMRAAGIDLDQLYKFDSSKLGDTKALAERLRGAGLGQGVDLDRVLAPLADPSKYRGVYEWQDKAQEILMQALGIKKGDAEARGIVNKAIGGHVNSANSGFELEGYFRGIAKLPLQAMKDMFGLQRISQAIKLREEINKAIKAADNGDLTKFRRLEQEFDRLMPGAIDRRAAPVMEGFAYAVDRAAASLARLRNAIFESGVGSGLTDALAKASAAVEQFSKTNPQALRDITIAIAGLAAVGVGGFALSKVAVGLGAIAAAVARLGSLPMLAAGGLAGMLFGDIGKLFETTHDPYGTNSPTSRYLEMRESLGGLFSELGKSASAIGSGIETAYQAVRKLFGFDGSGSLLVDSFNAVRFLVDGLAASIKFARESIEAWTKGSKAPDFRESLPRDWLKNAYDEYQRLNRMILGRDQSAVPHPAGPTPMPGADGAGRFASPVPLLPPKVDVTGQADVTVRSEVTVKVEGPGTVTGQQGGTGSVSVPLNTGKTMPDI